MIKNNNLNEEDSEDWNKEYIAQHRKKIRAQRRKKTTVDNNSVFIIQPNKHHLDHLSEDQCKIFIRIFNICLWLIELGFYNFWLSTTKELEIDPEFEELIKSLENAREQFKRRNIAE